MSKFCSTLYVHRHGGASRDAVAKLRSLPDIVVRGRWAGLSSLRHYEGHGRFQDSLSDVPRPTLTLGREAEKTFRRMFLAK